MRFKVYGKDKWFKIPRASNPDEEERMFLHNTGEWSEFSEEDFEKHLNRYNKLNKCYADLNGERIKTIVKDEPLRYGKYGFQTLLA